MGTFTLTLKQFFYRLTVFLSRITAWLTKNRSLHTARFAFFHELEAIFSDTLDGAHILLGKSVLNRLVAVKPRRRQKELGNVLLLAKTRGGKGLNIETNLFTWPYPLIVNDIKQDLWLRTAGFREKGRKGRAFKFDPRGSGNRFDPLEGKYTEFDLQSAATTLLFRPNEGENQIFTDSAITMLTQIFLGSRLEHERPLPFTYRIINEGLIGAATILEIISQKYDVYPNLATRFLDIDFNHADFTDKFLRSCWGTLTRRMNRILTRESVRSFTGSDFTAQDIITSGEHPISVYLCWPEKDLLSLSPLIQLVWDALINGMIDYYDSVQGKGCYSVLAVLDEIFRTGLPKLPEYATTVCGRNISLLISAQSRSQIDAAYGVFNANKLRGQMDSIVYYRPAPDDYETMAHIERVLGYKSGFAQSKTDYERGTSTGENEQRIPLIPAHETELIDDTEVIIKRSGIRPLLAKRLNWHDFPELEQRANIPPPHLSPLPELSYLNNHAATTTLWQRNGKLPSGYIDPDKRY